MGDQIKVTIKDVAKEAGVSISTVSKVINDSSRISAETKKRIKALMKEMNYHPNSMARSLVKQQTRNICIVKGLGKEWDAVSNPYVYEIINGMEYTAREADYLISIINVDEKKSLWDQLEDYVRTRRIDGFLIFASLAEKKLIRILIDEDFPFVIIGDPGYESTACWVDLNNEIAGQQAISSLIEKGAGKVLFLKGKGDDVIGKKRISGIRKYLKGFSRPPCSVAVRSVESTREAGWRFGKDLGDSPLPWDSLICSSSLCASGILDSLKEKGIHIPGEISIISFDKYPVSQLTVPTISVIHMDLKELGDQCCSALLKKIDDPRLIIQLTVSSSSLIPGGST